MKLLDGAELDEATGARGIQRAPWYHERLLDRVDAEAFRLQVTHGPNVGRCVLNVVTPDEVLLNAWLDASLRDFGAVYVDRLKRYAMDEFGLVWPGDRLATAALFRTVAPPLAALLDRAPRPRHFYLVVHYRHRGEPACVVLEYVLTTVPNPKA